MATLSLISPKSLLLRITDIFQKPHQITENTSNTTQVLQTQYSTPAKSRLNVSLDDLKVISTALLHYKRNLAKMGEMERAEDVGTIDKKFYDLIQTLEIQTSEEIKDLYTQVA